MKTLGFAMLLGAALLPGALYATSADHVRVSHAWLRILPGELPAGGYATLQNTGKQPAALTGAHSSTYADVMLHLSSVAGGTSRMRMAAAISIPAQGEAQLTPGGYHLMLSRPVHPVTPGDQVPLTLKFADGSTLDTTFIARPANAADAGPDRPALPTTHGAGHNHD